jgi:RNA polymerase sigma-70 factor, ECF subfamily
VGERRGDLAADGAIGDLVERAQHGDDVALGTLVQATQPMVWRLCRALGDPADVDDLVQETFVRAMTGLHAYRSDAPFAAWLLTIARRTCADHVRRATRRRRLGERLRQTHHEESERLETRELLDLVEHLEPERRLAFVLTQVTGLGYEEAAALCGCPVGTIRSRVARARAELLEHVRHAEAL